MGAYQLKALPFCESQLNFLILLAIHALLDGRSGLLRDAELWAYINKKPRLSAKVN
jgi:hypothetical protein